MNDKKISLIISENIQRMINEARENTYQQYASEAQKCCQQYNGKDAIDWFTKIYNMARNYSKNPQYNEITILSQKGMQMAQYGQYNQAYYIARDIWNKSYNLPNLENAYSDDDDEDDDPNEDNEFYDGFKYRYNYYYDKNGKRHNPKYWQKVNAHIKQSPKAAWYYAKRIPGTIYDSTVKGIDKGWQHALNGWFGV